MQRASQATEGALPPPVRASRGRRSDPREDGQNRATGRPVVAASFTDVEALMLSPRLTPAHRHLGALRAVGRGLGE